MSTRVHKSGKIFDLPSVSFYRIRELLTMGASSSSTLSHKMLLGASPEHE